MFLISSCSREVSSKTVSDVCDGLRDADCIYDRKESYDLFWCFFIDIITRRKVDKGSFGPSAPLPSHQVGWTSYITCVRANHVEHMVSQLYEFV